MNIGAQMLHLWRKDWLRTRWMFLLLTATTVTCVLLSRPAARPQTCIGRGECDNSALWLMQLMTALVAMVFVASIIQDDSPTDNKSFWVTHPISTGALLGEKLCYVFGSFLTLVVVGQTISLLLNGFLIWPSLPSFGITLYWVVSFVLTSVLLAASSRGTQIFVLMAIGLLLVRIISISGWLDFFPASYLSVEHDNARFRADVWLAVAFAASAWVYRAQTVRNRTRIYVVWTALAVLTIGWDSGATSGVRFFTAGTERPSKHPPTFRYSAIQTDSNFTVRISTKSPPSGRRYAVACPSYAVRFADRSTSIPTQSVSCARWQSATTKTLGKDSLNAGTDSVATTIVVPLNRLSDIAREIHRGTGLVIDGYIEEQSADVTTELFGENEVVAAQGSRKFTRTYRQATVGGQDFRSLEIRIQNAHERVTRIPSNAGSTRGTDAVANVFIGPEQLVENGYEFRAIGESGLDTTEMVIDSTRIASDHAQPSITSIGSPVVSLAFPSFGIAQTRAQLRSKCVVRCDGIAGLNSRLLVTPWRHVQYAPFHLEIPLPLR